METDSDTNLFFAIYQNEEGVRSYESIPLNIVIENQKSGLFSVPASNNGVPLKYVLSPNDLVYLPTPDQIRVPLSVDDIDRSRIYKMVSCTKTVCDFIPANIGRRIIEKVELGSNNKAQKAWSSTGWSDEMIKSICIPIKVDRVGRIIKIG